MGFVELVTLVKILTEVILAQTIMNAAITNMIASNNQRSVVT